MAPPPETQLQRWIKYGGNVALTTVVVVLLAAAVVYVAQRHPRRVDTTVAGVHSLKPQTLAVLSDLKGKYRIVSLYPRAADKDEQDYFQPVSDLLDLYARNASGITVDLIDPVNEPGKLDALIKEVTTKYGSEIKPYKEFLDAFPAFVEKFKAFSDTQGRIVSEFPIDRIEDAELAQTIITAQATLTSLPERLQEASDKIERRLKGDIPNYRGAVDDCQFELQILDQLLTRVTDDFKSLPPAPRTPAPIKSYVAENLTAYEEAQSLVKEQLDKAKALGELKLDALRDSIKRRTILVMGETDMKVLTFAEVWQAPDDLRSLINTGGSEKPRLKFAGEQQLSTTLASLSRGKKPTVIFVRPGGAPLTQSVFQRAQFTGVGRRLREANFEVVEKDLSGQFAMQAQMQGFPVTEATEEQMRDRSAIWIAFALSPSMGPQGPSPLPGKLKQHLDEGGSALLLVEPQRDDCAAVLEEFGVKARTDAVLVKEAASGDAAVASGDMIANAQRIPYIFPFTRYGDHPLTRPLGSLQGLLLPLTAIETRSVPGFRVTPLLPVPRTIRTWGETGIDPVFNNETPVFDEASDIPNTDAAPLYAGVAIEKLPPVSAATTQPGAESATARLVVLGTASSFSNNLLSIADPELERKGILTPRFPGNAELFINSVFWLARMDTMLAISPAAMEVNRIRDIPEGQLAFLRWGVLIVGLPMAVLAAGGLVYLRRRE